MKFLHDRRQVYRLWCLTWFLVLVLLACPVVYGWMRLTIVAGLAFLGGSGLFLGWRWLWVRGGGLAIAAILAGLLLLPGHAADLPRLRQAYVAELQAFEGTRYIWGGESKLGIDCSGLVRQGLIWANAKEGLRSLNPELLRRAIELWWYDAGADALRDEYRHFTLRLGNAQSINALDAAKLQPGDLAASRNGEHILAYIGNHTWVEADPFFQKVIEVTVPEQNNFWFNTPVYTLRWQQLQPHTSPKIAL